MNNYRCSECKEELLLIPKNEGKDHYNFCPFCGHDALVEKVDKNEEGCPGLRPFSAVADYIKSGGKAKRSSWDEGVSVGLLSLDLVKFDENGSERWWMIEEDDFLAEDWILLMEQAV